MLQDEIPRVDMDGLTAYLAGQRDVQAAYLHGSVARGQANRLSDVDVALLLSPAPAPEAAVERQLALAVALGPFADRDVQVTLLNTAPPQLAYEVIAAGRLLFERDPLARIAFEVRAMKRYFDVQPLLAAYDRELAQRIQEVGLGTRKRRHPSALGAAERVRGRLAGSAGR